MDDRKRDEPIQQRITKDGSVLMYIDGGGLRHLAQRKAQSNGPRQNANVVTCHQGMYRVVHHLHQQIQHHLADTLGRLAHPPHLANAKYWETACWPPPPPRDAARVPNKYSTMPDAYACWRLPRWPAMAAITKTSFQHRCHHVRGRVKKLAQNTQPAGRLRAQSTNRNAQHRGTQNLSRKLRRSTGFVIDINTKSCLCGVNERPAFAGYAHGLAQASLPTLYACPSHSGSGECTQSRKPLLKRKALAYIHQQVTKANAGVAPQKRNPRDRKITGSLQV